MLPRDGAACGHGRDLEDGLNEHGGEGFYVSWLDFLKYSLATGVVAWAGATDPGGQTTPTSSLEELFPGMDGFPAAGAVGAPEGVYVSLEQWDGTRPSGAGSPAGSGTTIRYRARGESRTSSP